MSLIYFVRSFKSAYVCVVQIRGGAPADPGAVLRLRCGRDVLSLYEIRTSLHLFSMQHHPPQS